MFRRMARDRPLAVVLDDLHWVQLPTLALLEHLVHSCLDTPTLVLGTFRTTAPDRSDELSARLADLHRLDSVRRLDLGRARHRGDRRVRVPARRGVAGRPRGPPRRSCATGPAGNPFFLRETWIDLERQRGRVGAARPAAGAGLARRHAGGPAGRPRRTRVRETIELAAVIGDGFDLPTLVRAGATDRSASMDAVDSAVAVGLVEAGRPGPATATGSCTR